LTPFPDAGFLHSQADPSSPRSFRCRISPDSRLFEGHFDGAPILPGVAHIALAVQACGTETGRAPTLLGLRDVRFRRPLGPGSEVDVVLSSDRDPSFVRFEIRSGGEIVTTGALRLASTDTETDG